MKTEVITLQRKKDLQILEQYDYTAHSNQIQSSNVPVVKFHYELSPMQVLLSCLDRAYNLNSISMDDVL